MDEENIENEGLEQPEEPETGKGKHQRAAAASMIRDYIAQLNACVTAARNLGLSVTITCSKRTGARTEEIPVDVSTLKANITKEIIF